MSKGSTLHVDAICEAGGCDFRQEGYTGRHADTAVAARRAGVKHARATGHRVRIESAKTEWFNTPEARHAE